MTDKRVIVALDVPSLDAADKLIGELAPHVAAFKIGMRLISAVGGPTATSLVISRGAPVFYDHKFNDIPETVAGAAREVTIRSVWGFTVHIDGGTPMLEAAVQATKQAHAIDRGGHGACPRVIGITVLTSLRYDDLAEVGLINGLHMSDAGEADTVKRQIVQDLVIRRALVAQRVGLDGVVASPQEAALIRKVCGPDLLIITPGIRPAGTEAADQKRIGTPGQAIRDGADFLVIGRPIIAAEDPLESLLAINAEVEEALAQQKV